MGLTEWWNSLSNIEHIFLYIGIPATVILFLQTILTFIGGSGAEEGAVDIPEDVDGDVDIDDTDVEGGGALHLFTVRNFIAFFTIFGWSGFAMSRGGSGTTPSIIVAVILGSVAMFLMALFFKMVLRLQSSGDVFTLNDAVGKTGVIFIPVPGNMEGYGKVHVVIGDKQRELKAVTSGDKLATGTTVTVHDVSNDRLVVERIES